MAFKRYNKERVFKMKKLLMLLLALALALPTAVMPVCAEDADGDLALAPVCDTDEIQVGDQFLVKLMIDGADFKYLVYSMAGSFDSEIAELVAPVYKDDGFSIIWNDFSNETGEFQFDAADIRNIEGSSDPLVLSLLFKAKKAGKFTLTLNEKCVLGKAKVSEGDDYQYDFEKRNFEADITEDTDEKDVVIIAEKERKTPYDDMFGYEWAEISVGALAKLGILEGFCEESFLPAQNITRGEFAALLIRSAKIEGTGEQFPDVAEDYKFAEEIKTAKKTGIALGDENGSFNPDAEITRQDICALVFRTLSYKHKMKPVEEERVEDYIGEFSDRDEISDYAVPAVAAVVRANLLKGDEGTLNPKANMTRAEAAVILESVIIHIKLVR